MSKKSCVTDCLMLLLVYLIINSSVIFGYGRIMAVDDSLRIKVDALFSRYDKPDSPGAAVAIVKGKEVIYVKGYGSSNLEYNIPLTKSTVFNLASVSKHITAYCIFLLESEGKLSIEDDIRNYLPELPDFGKVIKIKHLLHQTSGLRDPYGLMYLRGWNPLDVLKNTDVMRLLNRQKELNNDPGSSYMYSSSNYIVLSEIINKVSGKSLSDWAKENIFDPLGMKNTIYNEATDANVVKNRADAYNFSSKGGILNYSHLSSLVGTGGIYTSAEDIALWLINIFDPKVGTSETVKRLFQLEKMNDGNIHPYACGLIKNINYNGYIFYTHDGQIGGYKTYIALFPDDQLGIVVMSNLFSFSPWPIIKEISGYCISELWAKPLEETQKKTEKLEIKPDMNINKSVYDDYVGKYIIEQMNLAFEIIKENEKLFIQGTSIGRRELYPETESIFNISGDVGNVTFKRNQENSVEELILNSRGREIICSRIDGESSSEIIKPEEIQDYCGIYRSDEIDVTIEIEYSNNQFIAKHIMYGDMKLTPVSSEVWEGPKFFINTLKFIKGEDDKILGFRLTGHRVIRLLFEKEID
jgi:CubicO group peptidase (beta-lactamase class C family)